MPAADVEYAVETESERIQRWRVAELARAGYDAESAFEIAARTEIDLHLAVELLERGCPAATAVRILI